MAHLSAEEYFQHGQHNEDFLKLLSTGVLRNQSQFTDWALVITFYAALHYTKSAILRDHGLFSDRHASYHEADGTRYTGHNDLVREYLRPIHLVYRDLYDLSREARYRAFYKKPDSSMALLKRQADGLRLIKESCLERE
jgi:hypothetical protein